jgi:predicted nuclease of predicted toxin-antitoxin system
MPLLLLLDENISPVVAEQVQAKRPTIGIESIHTWRDGAYRATPDRTVLAAHEEGRTLATYDTQILSELYFFFADGTAFSGLVFINDRTIASSDFGALVRALIYLWDTEKDADWANRLVYLSPAP